MAPVTDVVIVGGGPAGYEAALVGAQLGGNVTLVERRGVGGAAVLTDVVPSKTLIATAETMTALGRAGELGIRVAGQPDADLARCFEVDLRSVHERVMRLARAQSADIHDRLVEAGVRVIDGSGRLDGTHRVIATTDAGEERLNADITLVSVGTRPRELPTARCDGERILNWTQVYNIETLPEHLIVVGSGVTGAEFASAYQALGVKVTLISSRHQVLPGQDEDAGRVIQDVFTRRGMNVISGARAEAARREGDHVIVTLGDGRQIEGSHCLMAVGSLPNTEGLGLAEAGIDLTPSGHIQVDRVSRTSARGVYAAGDCTGVFLLASVAAMQGRIAMWHSLGDAVEPLDVRQVSSTVFTAPEVATVGISQADIDSGRIRALIYTRSLATNARGKMQGLHDGFVKVFCLPTTGIIVGAVVVAPAASELIHPFALAVRNKLTVDEFANSFTVYPSLSGSMAEAARQLHLRAAEAVAAQS